MTDEEMAAWIVEHADEALRDISVDTQSDPLRLTTGLRRRFNAEQSRELALLCSLRQKARAKFARAEQMFFTTIGYEQSTSQAIAGYKAERFRARKTADLCCGIGGDAIAFADVSDAITIVDRSARAVAFAEANIRAHGRTANPQVTDIRSVDLAKFDAWHVDPDRRVDGARKTQPNACEPPLHELLDLQKLSPNAAIKLAPAANVEQLLKHGAELEWIGCENECRQLVAWFGDLARHPGMRTATWLGGKQAGSIQEFETVTQHPAPAERFQGNVEGAFVYEPRASVSAAQLTDALAHRHGMQSLSRESSLLVSDQREESLLFRRFRVHVAMSYHQKALEKTLTEHRLRVNEVKTRGAEIDPDPLLRQLAAATSTGEQDCAVIFYSDSASIRCLVAQRDDLAIE